MNGNFQFSPARGKSDGFNYLQKSYLILISINLVFFVGYYIALVLVPPFVQRQGASTAQVGWITSIFFLAMLSGRPLSAYLIQQVGAPFSLLLSLVFTLAVCATLPFMTGFAAVAVCCAAQGLFVAIVTSSLLVLVVEVAPAEKRGEALAVFGIAPNLAVTFAPSLGLTLMNSGGIILAFWSAAAMNIFCALFVAFIKQSEKTQTPQNLKSFSETSETDKAAIKSNLIVPTLVIASFGLTYAVHLGFVVIIAADRGISNGEAGIYYTFYAAAIVFARLTGGRVSDRRGRGWVIVPGSILVGFAIMIFALTHSLSGLFITGLVYGLGTGFLYPGVMAQMIDLTPQHRRGAVIAHFYAANEAGIVLGGLLFGWIVEQTNYVVALSAFSVVPLLAALLHFLFSDKREDLLVEI